MKLLSPTVADWKGYARFCAEVESPATPRRYACLGLHGMIGIRTLTEEEANRQNILFCQSGDSFRYVPFEEVETAWRAQHAARVRREPHDLKRSGWFAMIVLCASALAMLGALLFLACRIADAF